MPSFFPIVMSKQLMCQVIFNDCLPSVFDFRVCNKQDLFPVDRYYSFFCRYFLFDSLSMPDDRQSRNEQV